MRTFTLIILSILSLQATGQDYKPAANDLYGYTAELPLPMKHKGRLKSLRYAEDFVKHLRRDDGSELVLMSRSEVRDPHFKDQSGTLQPVGNSKVSMLQVHDFGGWLDVFTLLDVKSRETIKVYVDIYHSGEIMVPKGLKYTAN